MFSGRTGDRKEALLAAYGGTDQTERAVAGGLEWLTRNQSEDGSWSMRGPYKDGGFAENPTAATAMALLAFLGAGHNDTDGQYASTVKRGIEFLLGLQDDSGFFASRSSSHEKMYAQALATIAVCELYGMTKDVALHDKAQRALDFAMDAQSPQGGWRYQPKIDSDTSVTGWYVVALATGRDAGLKIKDEVLDAASGYFDTVATNDGAGYGYKPDAILRPTRAMTAAGLLSRQYTGWKHDDPPMVRGASALLFDETDSDVYYFYYASQVLRNVGGQPWRAWNQKMGVALSKAQVKDGPEAGSWNPGGDRWGHNAGRLYVTCFSLFCLEVYYRYQPFYSKDGGQGP
jgi:hypothetical protein